MTTRMRSLGALLALLAFSAYFAEGVWAAMCPPEMEAYAPAAAQMDGDTHAAHAEMHQDCAEPSEGPEHSRSDAPPCPFLAAGAGGSCVSVSLPGAGASLQPFAPEASSVSISPDAVRNLLLVSTLFHPPRA